MTDNHNQQQGKLKTGDTPGSLLRQAREASGQTQSAVGEVLHLTVHYIKSLENDEYSKLPGLTFVKGYVRAYARYMKLDVDAVLRCYDDYVNTLPEAKSHTASVNYSYSRKRNDQAIGWAIAATLVVVFGLGAGWWFVGRDAMNAATKAPVNTVAAAQSANQPVASSVINQSAAPVTTFVTTNSMAATSSYTPAMTLPATDAADVATLPATDATGNLLGETQTAVVSTELPTTVPATDSSAIASTGAATDLTANAATTPSANETIEATDNLTVTPNANGGRQLTLQAPGNDEMQLMFTGNSWVEIDDGRNVRIFSEMLRPGDTLVVQGQAPFQVLLGDGRNVQVNFNSTAIDIRSSVRTDSTARLNLANPVSATVPVGAPQ